MEIAFKEDTQTHTVEYASSLFYSFSLGLSCSFGFSKSRVQMGVYALPSCKIQDSTFISEPSISLNLYPFFIRRTQSINPIKSRRLEHPWMGINPSIYVSQIMEHLVYSPNMLYFYSPIFDD